MDITYQVLKEAGQKTVEKIRNFNLSELANYSNYMLNESYCNDFININDITKLIQDNFLGWVRSGILLETLKNNFDIVYKEKIAKNWKEYCSKYLGKSVLYVKQIIDASKVILILHKKGINILPANESQARHLTKFLPNSKMNENECNKLETKIIELWQKVIKAGKGNMITADLVKSVIDPDSIDNKKENVKVSNKNYVKLLEQALELNFKNVDDYIEAIANRKVNIDNSIIEKVEEEKLEIWEKDLEDLITEEKDLEDTLETVNEIIKVIENIPVNQVKEEIKFTQILASNLILIFNLIKQFNLILKPT